jgi:hypothetical protein
MMTNGNFQLGNKYGQFLLILAIIVLQSSCQSNEFYIDFDKQLICSSNSKGILNLDIENDSSFFHLRWSNPTITAPLQLSISPLTKEYTVTSNFSDSIFNTIKLQKNHIYLIKRSQGDAGSFSIKVRTDENGYFSKIVM